MIKKIFFQSIFFNFFFLKEVFAAESGGMPQLNPEFWISQIFWLNTYFWYFICSFIKTCTTKDKCKFRITKIPNTRKY